MSATAATKQKPLKRHPSKLKKMSAYTILAIILISIMAVLFAFPLYWIITGSFKTGAAINSTTPEWWPSQWVLTNYQKLFSGKSAPLWQLAVPFGSKFSANGEPIYFSVGPTAPAAIRWMINTVFMAVMSMILTCITAAMAGYALAKKRFVGRKLLFTLIVCAMALPKQVILIPLLREMSALNLYNTIWAVIFPIVGWPFGVFLMKQFSEGIPTEMLEAARIDGASEARTFVKIVLPMVKPGIGALAIFTFINSWNDYFMQLIMLSSTSNLTISLGIAKLQAELAEERRLSQLAAQSAWRDISEVTFADGDRYLLANLIYCEAGNQPYEGQVAVGAVVINRVLSSVFPDTVVGVIYQNKQFSPVASGRLALALAEDHATAACYRAADEAMAGATTVGNCLFFRTPIDGLTGTQIGGHIFY